MELIAARNLKSGTTVAYRLNRHLFIDGVTVRRTILGRTKVDVLATVVLTDTGRILGALECTVDGDDDFTVVQVPTV